MKMKKRPGMDPFQNKNLVLAKAEEFFMTKLKKKHEIKSSLSSSLSDCYKH